MSIYEYDEEKHNRTLYLEGKEEGYSEGELAGKMDDAIKMKLEGLASEMICRITGLSFEEIEAL